MVLVLSSSCLLPACSDLSTCHTKHLSFTENVTSRENKTKDFLFIIYIFFILISHLFHGGR